MDRSEILRYVANGLVATLVHFLVLTLNVEWIGFESAGLSNLIAATFGIATSFIGSRYYVFKKHEAPVISQASLFFLLYGIIAVVHGLILLVWTDVYGNNYRIGFLIATVFQVIMSYIGNKYLVFSK